MKLPTTISLLALAATVVLAPILFGQGSKENAAPAKPEKEMRIFLFTGKPSPAAWKYMKENPGDRKAATAASLEKVGCKMISYYWGLTTGKNYIIIAVPDGKTAQAMLVQRLSSDLLLEYDAIELVPSSQMPAVIERVKELDAADDSLK